MAAKKEKVEKATKEVKEEKKTSKKNVNKVEVTVKIEGEVWKKALDQAFQKKVKDIKMDGFRPGHVPRAIFEKKFGIASLFPDAADLVLQDAYTKALEEKKVVPVVQPQVALNQVDENGVEFIFTIITKPDVKVNQYKDLHVTKEEVQVTKEEIEHELAHLLERYTELEVKDGQVAEGDVAIIDFEGFKDGVPFDGGKGENYSLEIGSHTFIPGFEEQLVGMKAGEEKDIKVTFPEDYHEASLKGQEVTFHVKVNDIKHKVQRELDEEFFEDLGMEGVNSKETLEQELEANIRAQKDMDAENKYVDRLFEEIAKHVEVEIPEEMVEEEIDRLLNRFRQQMQMQGISLDMYYQFTKTTEQDLRNQMEKDAYQNVLYRLMLEEILNMEKIEVSNEEADKEAEELAKKYQMPKEEFLKAFGGIEMVQYDLEMRKLVELLKEYNK